MRSLKRNAQTIYYAKYLGITDVLDNGKVTGEKAVSYSKPIAIKVPVSAPSGMLSNYVFGGLEEYDRSISLTAYKSNIDEFSIFWIDCIPVIKDDGSTDTPHDYEVKKISKSLNETAVALSKVKVR